MALQLGSKHAADQHLCFGYIDSIILLLPKSEISSLKPSCVAAQPGPGQKPQRQIFSYEVQVNDELRLKVGLKL